MHADTRSVIMATHMNIRRNSAWRRFKNREPAQSSLQLSIHLTCLVVIIRFREQTAAAWRPETPVVKAGIWPRAVKVS